MGTIIAIAPEHNRRLIFRNYQDYWEWLFAITPEPHKPLVADFIVRAVQAERRLERTLGFPYKSLEGLVLVYGNIEKAQRSINDPVIQSLFLDPEINMAVLVRSSRPRNSLYYNVPPDFTFPDP